MNRGPELLGAPKSGAKKTLGVGGLHRFPDPAAGPRVAKPHLCSQHFGLQFYPLGPAQGIDGPQVTVEPGPLLRDWQTPKFKILIYFKSVVFT